MMIQRWLFSLPSKRRVEIADALFLEKDSADQALERDELRKKRQFGLQSMAAASLGAIPAILGASIWESDERVGAQALATAAIFFAVGFVFAVTGIFLSWFEPVLRRKAPIKRFVIGPDDQGDHDDQATEYWERDWVEENAHEAIPRALSWRAAEAAIWVAIVASVLLFATGLMIGGLGVLSDLAAS